MLKYDKYNEKKNKWLTLLEIITNFKTSKNCNNILLRYDYFFVSFRLFLLFQTV